MEPFAKGKRGLVFLTTYQGKSAILKKKNPTASIDTMRNEADMLVALNKHNIGPQFYAFENGALIREYIAGEEFLDYLAQASKREIIRVLTEILYQCRTMDLLGINKFELTRPFKHILITTTKTPTRKKGEVVQIDFERCRYTEQPKNVTQFAQCIMRGNMHSIFTKQNITVDAKKIVELTKSYKQKLELKYFNEIIQSIGGTIREPETFAEKVYQACEEIPEGKVVTYKEIAHYLGTRAYRAVGTALKKNPYSPRIPCHRVVASSGAIGGFMGTKEGAPIDKKRALLNAEGVTDFKKSAYSFPAKVK